MSDVPRSPYQLFSAAVSPANRQIDLVRAALLIGESEYPGLDPDLCVNKIDALATKVVEASGPGSDALRTLAALNHVLFVQERYRGNQDEYYDPRNSFLNEVMERKLGIPISLSVLYIEVAKKTGLKISGVSFPGHFLVKYAGEAGEIIIDPFHGGQIASLKELHRRLAEASNGRVTLRPEHLKAASEREILARMLNNLKAIYLRHEDYLKALDAVERLLILQPDSASEIRDRGILFLKLECFTQAQAGLERYLELRPEAEDAEEVRVQLASVKERAARIH